MKEQVIKLSDNAVQKIKEIMSNAEKNYWCKSGCKVWRLRWDVLCHGVC